MPNRLSLQDVAPPDVSDGARTLSVLVQRPNTAIHSTNNQSEQADVCRAIQYRSQESVYFFSDSTLYPRGLKAKTEFGTLTATSLANSAYFTSLNDSVEGFNNSVTQDRRDLLIDKQTKFSVLLEFAQEDLKKRFSVKTPQSKRTQIWRNIKSSLEKFCQVVYHYSSVMDVLVSAHPQVAALAWGAIKFLLAVSVNHQELKGKIVYHLAEIGEQFKIIDSYVRLFSEADMVEHVCGVYDTFTQFLQLSIDWCKENAFVKFFKNVALPYEARIKPSIDELNRYIRKVKERVEVHNTHRLAVMQNDVSALLDILDDSRRLQVDFHAIIAQLQGIISDQTKQCDPQIGSMPGDTYACIEDRLSSTSSIPKEGFNTFLQTLSNLQPNFEHLKDCAIQSVQIEANHSYLALDLPNKPEVKAWSRSDKSALLWVDGFANSCTNKWTTEFSVDVLLRTQQQSNTVLFYFGDIVTSDVAKPGSRYLTSSKAIIHSFIVQLLRQHPWLAEKRADWLTPERWTEARRSTKTAWYLLHYLLQSVSADVGIVYLIIDSIDALSTVNDRLHDLQPFLRHLSTLVTSSPSVKSAGSDAYLAVKVLLTSVTGSLHSLLFPPNAASSLPFHSIVHIPQIFGQHNVASTPVHLRKPSAKRLVRLPDSDDEFGFKSVDSFEFSDEENEDLMFSSEEEINNSYGIKERQKDGGNETYVQRGMPQPSPRNVNKILVRSESGSSEELDFSENETDNALRRHQDTDDIQFSSSSEEELSISSH